ncbi:squalene synthase HpnC [Rhodopila sp.]|uniref:squalene synthase HpnC n=1 Tax=Rhodopila sp. TaxID=2480087 RepID=UPI003D0FE828
MTETDVSTLADVETWSGKGRHDENFPVGSRLIARRHREPIHRYYSFARNADDIADSASLSAQQKIDRLDIMEDVLLGHRQTGSPSAAALRASLSRTGITSKHATDLLVAFRQDATKLRYATVEELHHYCRYSAVPVGRYVLDVHGESSDCHAPSDALCTSLQIINHIQDCATDLAELDRCYLPQALLAQFGASIEDLRRPDETAALRRVFMALLEQVDRMNLEASALPKAVRDRRLRAETAIICGLATRLTKRLTRNDPLAKRVKLQPADAVFSVLAAAPNLL